LMIRQNNFPAAGFSMYPNPVIGQVTIESDCCSSSSQSVSMRLVGMDGKEIGSVTGNLRSINTYINDNLNSIKSGIYMMYLQSQSGSTVLKFVKH
jgi:hypothetical protein